jgi:hypothetical protein
LLRRLWCCFAVRMQGLFVGGKFEVYISDNKDHTHSIELRWVDRVLVRMSSLQMLKHWAVIAVKCGYVRRFKRVSGSGCGGRTAPKPEDTAGEVYSVCREHPTREEEGGYAGGQQPRFRSST